MSAEIRDYPSRLGDEASKRYGVFSYLPAMDAAAIRKQVEYIAAQGWNPAIEHVEPARSGSDYWYMWKLPMFGERDVNTIMNELTSCRNANPDHHIRIIGYDNKAQSQGLAFVVYRAGKAA